jgi:hypothetical protein
MLDFKIRIGIFVAHSSWSLFVPKITHKLVLNSALLPVNIIDKGNNCTKTTVGINNWIQ